MSTKIQLEDNESFLNESEIRRTTDLVFTAADSVWFMEDRSLFSSSVTDANSDLRLFT